jgi:hypothetical protein
MDVDEELPEYMGLQTRTPDVAITRRELTTHETTANTSKGTPWLTLKVRSRARNPTQLPQFWEGDTITGSVDLDLQKPESIVGVTISVRNTFWTYLQGTKVRP